MHFSTATLAANPCDEALGCGLLPQGAHRACNMLHASWPLGHTVGHSNQPYMNEESTVRKHNISLRAGSVMISLQGSLCQVQKAYHLPERVSRLYKQAKEAGRLPSSQTPQRRHVPGQGMQADKKFKATHCTPSLTTWLPGTSPRATKLESCQSNAAIPGLVTDVLSSYYLLNSLHPLVEQWRSSVTLARVCCKFNVLFLEHSPGSLGFTVPQSHCNFVRVLGAGSSEWPALYFWH
jgi:hypothetical protein